MIKLITFDCYGTLVDTAPFYEAAGEIGVQHQIDRGLFQKAFELYEDRMMYGEYFMPYEQVIEQALRYCAHDFNYEYENADLTQMLTVQANLKVFPEVIDFLKTMKAKGIQLGIMTDASLPILKQNLAQIPVEFDYLYTSDQLNCYKPTLNFFGQVADQLTATNEEHLHIAAGYWWDIIPCQRLNWQRIWVNRKQAQALPTTVMQHEVADLTAAIDLI
ncbi:HAD hydrolase-like protein [Latilactobacillus sakei]|uniref:HAD family hydrolase n=1 Tax=Latilactobacillus sakei TaxID=1599 RepID=UPI002449DE21|nr:HAD family hydrolase [Latilactobacillus sakei]MDH0600440.1 HAD hydrolase-like protein [Latilactobacillus sakei]